MSLEIEQNKVFGSPQVAQDRRSIVDKNIPADCLIPGYWDSLAENTKYWAGEISAGPLWQSVNTELVNWRKEYYRNLGGVLSTGIIPKFVGKSAARIEEKVFSKIQRAENVEQEIKRLFDQSVPVPRLEDLVRVRLPVQFLDGVPFLAKKINELAKKFDPSASIEAKGNLNGYFAQHITFKWPVYFRFGGGQKSCDVTCEVQIATSLATHVWENSHGLYENARVNLERSEDWQWSPNDPRFLSRQLGHMIHLADGLFCNLRDSSK